MSGQLHIRLRERRGHVKEAQGYTEWSEWQVLRGSRIVARCGTQDEAHKIFYALRDVKTEATS